jgi:hypothetical protein
VQQNWCRCGSVETTLESGGFEYHGACDEKASAVEKLRLAMKSASAKSVVNGRSQVRAVTCHLNDDAEKRQASRRAVEENQSSVTGRSRCRGKAAAPNERRHHVVKFELKPVVYREVPCDSQ